MDGWGIETRQPDTLAQSRLKLARRETLAANMARKIASADEDQFLALHVGTAVGRRWIIEHSFPAAAAGRGCAASSVYRKRWGAAIKSESAEASEMAVLADALVREVYLGPVAAPPLPRS